LIVDLALADLESLTGLDFQLPDLITNRLRYEHQPAVIQIEHYRLSSPSSDLLSLCVG
jgi:hypothetical protein